MTILCFNHHLLLSPSLSLSSVQCSSWLLDSSSTPSASTHPWSGPTAETLTFTMPATVRSAGATCWPSLESCSPYSCPFLPNTHQRSSCPPPLYPPCYSESLLCLVLTSLIPTTISDPGFVPCRDSLHLFRRNDVVQKSRLTVCWADTLQQTPSSCIWRDISSISVI